MRERAAPDRGNGFRDENLHNVRVFAAIRGDLGKSCRRRHFLEVFAVRQRTLTNLADFFREDELLDRGHGECVLSERLQETPRGELDPAELPAANKRRLADFDDAGRNFHLLELGPVERALADLLDP